MAWIECYPCGCSADAEVKRDLPGYCGTHGGDYQTRYRTTKAGIAQAYKRLENEAKKNPQPRGNRDE